MFGKPEPEPAPETQLAVGRPEDPRGDDPLLDEILRDTVLQYRCERFVKAGFTLHQSRVLACDRSVDLHFVIDHLLGRGCDTHTAFDIAA